MLINGSRFTKILALIFIYLACSYSSATVVMTGTRVIFPRHLSEQKIQFQNKEIENKSAYYISIIDIHFIKDGNRVDLNNEIDNSLPPYSTKSYLSTSSLESKVADKLEIHFNLIDDHGAVKSYQIII